MLLNLGYVSAACQLFKNDANCNLKDALLEICVQLLSAPPHGFAKAAVEEALKALIRHGLSVESVLPGNRQSILQLACQAGYEGAVQYLIDQKASVNHADIHGDTALHMACRKGDSAIVKILIEAGAKVEIHNKELVQPLVIVLWCIKDEDLALAVVNKHPNPNFEVQNGTTLIKAMELKFLRLAKKIIEKSSKSILNSQDKEGKTALHHAVDNDLVEAIPLLLAGGANPNIIAANEIPLTSAFKKQDKACALALIKGTTEYIGYLDKRTMLAYACQQGYLEVVKLLLTKKGILNEIDKPDKEGKTALHHAVDRNLVEAIPLLLACGANPKIQDANSRMALTYAFQKQDKACALALLEGMDEFIGYNNGETVLGYACRLGSCVLVQKLLGKKQMLAQIDQQDKEGKTALHRAVDSDLVEAIPLLLACGANPNILDANSQIALTYAFQKQDKACALALVEEMERFFDYTDGKTALGYACRQGSCVLVQKLLGKKQMLAQIDKQDKEGKTALHYAMDRGYAEIASLLLSCGANATLKNQEGKDALDSAFERPAEESLCLFATHHRFLGYKCLGEASLFHFIANRGWMKLWNIACKQKEACKGEFDYFFSHYLEQIDNHKRTPLHVALYGKYEGLALHMLQQYIDAKLALDKKDDQGNTYLHLALQLPSCDVAMLLVAYLQGADFNTPKWRNQQGLLPIDYVRENPVFMPLLQPLGPTQQALGRNGGSVESSLLETFFH
jgi:ankyrin repeat protein